MVLISFQDLYKIHIFPKFHECGSKIMPATPFWNLNFKWAWQAQFLSHTYETLEKYVFYIDLQMILVPFFKIHDGSWDKNLVHCCRIHILSHPWFILPWIMEWMCWNKWCLILFLVTVMEIKQQIRNIHEMKQKF